MLWARRDRGREGGRKAGEGISWREKKEQIENWDAGSIPAEEEEEEKDLEEREREGGRERERGSFEKRVVCLVTNQCGIMG